MYDIITVGSSTVDVFVKTGMKNVKIANLPERDVCYPIGSKILVDDLHFDTGGGGTNCAVAFARLGFKTGWIGKLGHDANSSLIHDVVKKEHVDFLGGQGEGLAGYSVILVGVGKDRTILTYKGINDALCEKDFDYGSLKTKWFYFSSMMNDSFKTLEKLAKFARKNGINYAFNPSSYLAQKGLRFLRGIIDGCSVLVLNKEEAELLSGKKERDDVIRLLQKYARIVVVTDGANGAVAFDGSSLYVVKPNRVKIVETTGAGDAFASGVVAGLMLGRNLDVCLQMGAAEAESVIQYIGAKNVLLDKSEIDKVLGRRGAKVSVGGL